MTGHPPFPRTRLAAPFRLLGILAFLATVPSCTAPQSTGTGFSIELTDSAAEQIAALGLEVPVRKRSSEQESLCPHPC